MLTRRELLKAGSLWIAGLALARPGWSGDNEVITISMRSSPDGSIVYFDPVGVLVKPGQRIRWVNDGSNVHTATAYHPANDNHALRIPAMAVPWNSGYLVNAGDSYEVRLTEEGIYDYYCIPHEEAGMVGRIIVSRTKKFNPAIFEPYPDNPRQSEWKIISAAALRNFPSSAEIFVKGRVGGNVPLK
jgi:plastocyanin